MTYTSPPPHSGKALRNRTKLGVSLAGDLFISDTAITACAKSARTALSAPLPVPKAQDSQV
jgi:hypothetical protein